MLAAHLQDRSKPAVGVFEVERVVDKVGVVGVVEDDFGRRMGRMVGRLWKESNRPGVVVAELGMDMTVAAVVGVVAVDLEMDLRIH